MNRQTPTKQAIVEAALHLFHLKGYHATSIRDIANKAKVNAANIAYYFKNKQGLLEFCFISYLEEYILVLDKNMTLLELKGPQHCLMNLVKDILAFQRENFLAARFIYGESSLDSNLNREIHSTYFTKEKSYFQYILEQGIKSRSFQQVSVPMYMLQLKGLLTAPVLHTHYAMDVLHVFPQEAYYTNIYANEVGRFLQDTLFIAEDLQPLLAGRPEVFT
ncbi:MULTISPECIES: forespore capture DNA-binding protein RefZ [Bacillaceae]|jgi:AcrR family transcriptional regulator|uniref:forespore capture DNA-binding protein RefZ n=1 Tax=Bacillaceae TaxID=186817 RepID=UPI000BF96759|nr:MULTISPECIES: forespore capture DNA-binding protein RefZ [Bacillaceae]PEZ83597.1 TetR family transcriptional regulator [Bacillus sp. AFS017274]